MGIRDWFKRDRGATAAPDEARSYKIVVQVGEDGFIPALQFEGSNLETLLKQATWSYVCLSRIAQDVSELPPVVQRKDRDGEWVKDSSHELNRLLERPFGRGADAPPWDWSQLAETLVLHHQIKGNAYLRPAKDALAKRLVALHLLNPAFVRVKADDKGVARTYEYSQRPYPASEIVNIMNATPGSYYKGIGPLEAAQTAIAVDYHAHQRVKYNMEQRLSPGIVVKVKSLFGMDDEQREKIRTFLKDEFEGAANEGKPLITSEGTDLDSPPPPKKDDIPQHRDQARQEILSIFNVPPPIVGIMDNATLQNADVAYRIYWSGCLQPVAGNIYKPINTQAIQPVYGSDVRLWYELADNEMGLAILRGRTGTAEGLFKLGYPANMAARRVGLGMPHVPELDTPNATLAIAGREQEPSK